MSNEFELELIRELYSIVMSPLGDEERAMEIAQELSRSRDKQAVKLAICESLGVDSSVVRKYRIRSSIRTMVECLWYLKGLGVDVEKAVRRFPILLNCSVESMQKRVEYLRGLGVGDIGKAVSKLPQLLGLSVESMQKRVEYLRGLGMDVGKVVNWLPSLLGCSVEKMQMHVEYLKGLGIKDVGKAVSRLPSLLEYSVEGMQKRVEYLKGLGIKDVGKAVSRSPSLLGLSVESMQKRVEYLRGLGMDVGKVISKFPQLLGLSVEENLEPKVRYLVEEVGMSIDGIERDPSLLAYSLEGRIKPRWELLKRLGKGRLTDSQVATCMKLKDIDFMEYLLKLIFKL